MTAPATAGQNGHAPVRSLVTPREVAQLRRDVEALAVVQSGHRAQTIRMVITFFVINLAWSAVVAALFIYRR